MKALDFTGKELQIGDDVVFMQIGYRNLMKSKIKSISDKKVRITHEKTNVCGTETLQFHNQVIKV